MLRALVTLESALPAHLSRRVAKLGAAVAPCPPGSDPTADPGHLAVCAPADVVRRHVAGARGHRHCRSAATVRVPGRRRHAAPASLRVLMLGAGFEVHEPAELREHLRALAGRAERGGHPPERGPVAGRD